MFSVDGNLYNRFVNLDNIEYRLIYFLAKSDSKYAENLWKILKYDDPDCLLKPDLTFSEKMNLLYTDNGDATQKRVFMSPYVDDGWELQSSHLHIYVKEVVPKNRLTALVNIGIECIVHNKISNIIGDANELNPQSNPSEFDDDGNVIVRYKSRATTMLKCVMATLNGSFPAGVGTLQFNREMSNDQNALLSLWNNRKFFGFSLTMSTFMSGASDNEGCGY